MRVYAVTITMPDGSQGHHHGLYGHGIDAVIGAIEVFPMALRISAQPVQAEPPAEPPRSHAAVSAEHT